MSARRILYLQHAGALGGSCMSLLSLIQGLDQTNYEPIVACIHPTPSILGLYGQHGIRTLYWPHVSDFPHTTAGWYPLYSPLAVARLVKRVWRFWPSVKAVERLVDHVRPDLVHLNSLTLAPAAVGARRSGVPLVWHIRESVVPGHFGLRKRLLTELVLRLADEAVFICNFDRQQLTGGRKGIVIYNFVEFARFDHSLNSVPVRAELGLEPDAKVVLFLGGISSIKGIFPLLEALHRLKHRIPDLYCLVGGGSYQQSRSLLARTARKVFPLLGTGTSSQLVHAVLDRYQMRNYVHLLPFRADVEYLIAASDVVVFPSVEPHFARPVIEAGAMSKPVVASRIGGVEELVEDNVTGLLVPPGNVQILSDALGEILTNPARARDMGEQGLIRAQKWFNAQTNIQRITAIYEKLLNLPT